MVKVLLAAVTITVVAGAGYVVATRGNDQNETQQTTTQELSNAEQSETPRDESDQSDTKTENNEVNTIPEGWVLNETQFGQIYFPEEEGEIAPQRQNDTHGANQGFISRLKTYDLYFYDLDNTIIQFNTGKGEFYPCRLDVSTLSGSGVSIVLDTGETYTTTDEVCGRYENVVIEGQTLLDVQYGWHSKVSDGLLMIGQNKMFALAIRTKQVGDDGCYTGEGVCDETKYEKNKSSLYSFVELFLKANQQL